MVEHRREIDGLRAVAVWPVILFHAGAAWIPGGYVGVDVFFVISGYLITSIIVGGLDSGTFTLADFWERRARRILPALFFMMLCCIPFAWLWMLPDDLENFGQSLVSSTLFANNLLLAVTTGYWDALTEFKPLYHTWSLAVEEQFYLVYPLLVLALTKLAGRRGLIVALFAIAATSLAFACLSLSGQAGGFMKEAAYLLLPHRAWELLIGALLVFLPRNNLGATESATLSLCGLGLILVAALLFTEVTPVPGAPALLPTIGTALFLRFSSASNGVGRLLASGPISRMGLLSYSAYLWHQPILAFLRIYSEEPPNWFAITAAVCLTWFLAALSYRFVKTPSRKKLPLRGFAAPAMVAATAVICFGVGAHYATWVP